MVWHDNDIAGTGKNRGEAPGDIGYAPFFAAAQPNVVVQAQLAGENQMQAGENIREGLLQAQSHGHTANAQGSHDRCDGDAVILQHDQHAHGIDDDVDDVVQQRGLRQGFAAFLSMDVDHSGQCTCNDTGQGIDDDGEQDVGKQAGQGLADVNGVDGPIDADAEAPGERHAAQCMDEYVLQRVRSEVQAAADAAVDEFVQEDADDQRGTQHAGREKKHLKKMGPVDI